jgi:hypothetical protein
VRNRVAYALASKYHMNICNAHQHHSSKTWSVCSRYQCIDGGTLQDRDLTQYVFESDQKNPEWTPAFVVINAGVGECLDRDNPPEWWARRINGKESHQND